MSVKIGTPNNKPFPKVSITVVGFQEEINKWKPDWDNLKVYVEFNGKFYKCSFEAEEGGYAVFLGSDIDNYKDNEIDENDEIDYTKIIEYTNIMFTIKICIDNPDVSTIEASYKTTQFIRAKLSVM